MKYNHSLSHWALEHMENDGTLSQKYGKFENVLKVIMFDFINISNTFGPYLIDLLLKI